MIFSICHVSRLPSIPDDKVIWLVVLVTAIGELVEALVLVATCAGAVITTKDGHHGEDERQRSSCQTTDQKMLL